MNDAFITHQRNQALGKPPGPTSIRRVFNNDQIIERFGRWLLACHKAEKTRVNYTIAARQFAKFLDKPLTSATKEDVRAFLFSLYGKMAPTTIQARLDALRVLFDCLQLGSQVRFPVPRQVLRRKLPKRLPPIKTEEEIGRLIAAAQTPRELVLIELGYASGLRVAELANLNIEDIDVPAGTLIVRHGKGGDDRKAYFGNLAAKALRVYIGRRQSGPLFYAEPRRQRGGVTRGKHGDWWGQWREIDPATGRRVMRSLRLGDYEIKDRDQARRVLTEYLEFRLDDPQAVYKRLSTRSLFRVVVTIAKRAGVEGMHPHILRHSCATHCLDHGMDIRHVQEVLGHKGLGATQQYLHVSMTKLKDVHDKFFPRG
jgi:integrase/recombinase XerC